MFKVNQLLKYSAVFIFILIFSVACSSKTDKAVKEEREDEPFLRFEDDRKERITLQKEPKRIVVLNAPFLSLLYDLGGEAVGKATFQASPIPKGAEGLPEVGTVNHINLEELIALKPDLVIGAPQFHQELANTLKTNDIPVALMQMSSFEDVKTYSHLFGKIIGDEKAAQEKIKQTEERIQEIIDRTRDEDKPKVAILNVTPDSISIQRSKTTALEVVRMLGFENIAKDMEQAGKNPTTAPYSIEKLVAEQPDFIFITIHGAVGPGKQKIAKDLESNPAWASLQAVKKGHVDVLPTELFLANPGLHYDTSLQYLTELVYGQADASDK